MGSLTAIGADIHRLVGEANHHAAKATEIAIKVGALLTEAKGSVDHGQWEAWLTTHTPLAPRTARAYMRLSAQAQQLNGPERQRVADLPVREAIKAMSTSPESPPRSPSVHDCRRSSRERMLDRYNTAMSKLRKPLARRIESGLFKSGEIDTYRRQVQSLLDLLNDIESDARAAGNGGFIGEVTDAAA
ncbi:DUF3102 domain-containing protein [Pseudoxanthomonas winnipegensis]|uniref:DUF3102 domain-containing protein n=1 Tax=Pseudoxanthomonas winnipegensis TaxID=2480810 RepID=A0A4V2HDG8_9GAMM|nr:DUF3102 domain-containing protein [Pseudoxanthomonas winnipegensis]RZZ88919.1 DUF3102 domain-containing protein [Pseudoxanthomonas winnipegensis]TAA27372.1 DUF3102 domain-containing protein [Pseudoxanthomonas winnipegensis]TBV75658.1 DUF3102 domain-containing protein [Pseudoxanthomonas winnipegensis]